MLATYREQPVEEVKLYAIFKICELEYVYINLNIYHQ